MDQSAAIRTAENALRTVVREMWADDWAAHIPEKALETAKGRQAEEPKVRPGAINNDDLMSYIDLSVLTKLILDNWERFKPVFGNIKRTREAFNALNVYRRRDAHERPLLTFEQDLVSGISGLLRNQVAIYRQSKEPQPNFFAQIETCVDNMGRPGARAMTLESGRVLDTLSIGQTVEFTATAVDPRDRPFMWALSANNSQYYHYPVCEKQEGNSFRTTWTATADKWMPVVTVFITVRNASRYTKENNQGYLFDDYRTFTYRIEPPM